MMKRVSVRTQQRLAWGLLILAVLIYIVEMSHQALLRYDTFKATAFDLGNMDQVLWNTLHGRPFQFTNQAIDWYGPPTRLAIHFEPILLPLSLLYAFHADPRILLVFQTLALAAGALPVFLLARKYLPEWPILAALFSMAYLLSPALLGLNIFDFHPISLATPLLLYALLAFTYRRYIWFLIACVLAAACKEDVPLAIAMLGVLLLWRYKHPRLGITLIVGGLVWSFLAFGVIIPHFYPGVQHNNYWYRYESLGSSPGAAIVNLVFHPWLLFTTFFTMERVYYLASLFRNVGFLCLLAPEWLLPALPSLAVNLFSTNDPLLYSGVYHYNATIIPFVMLAAIQGTSRLLQAWRTWRGEEVVATTPGLETREVLPGAGAVPIRLLTSLGDRLSRLRAWSTARSAVVMVATFLLRFIRPAWWRIRWERYNQRMTPLAKQVALPRLQWIIVVWVILMVALDFLTATPTLNGFWADHDPGPREQQIQQLLAMIPPTASVSASDNLNPHLSEREQLAVFPSVSGTVNGKQYTVEYVIVDLNAIFPQDRAQTVKELNQLVNSRQFRPLARKEGVVLLVRRSTSPLKSAIIDRGDKRICIRVYL
ncbi:MAG: DUF2079 domain-containing protein [Chloroflexota bacterium]|nr:DUF2079 domain-containing protein [Chloroflexota bacterium]